MTKDTGEPKGQKKLTRAEARAINQAAHREKNEAKAAARKTTIEQAINNTTGQSLLPPPHSERSERPAPAQTTSSQSTAPDTNTPHERETGAPGLAHDARPHAQAHARAHEGEVLADDAFAGLMDAPVPPETPATSRYVGLPYVATPSRDAEVMALRYAGQTDEEIALFLGCSIESLYREHRTMLAEAHAKMSGRLAIRLATAGITGDFKAMKFLAEKRLRGFGNPNHAFEVVRGDVPVAAVGRLQPGGQSAAAMAQRKKVTAPEPDEDGIIEIEMVLGVAERPLVQDDDGKVRERTDAEIEADLAEREAD